MISERSGRESFVHIVLPGETAFTVAGRFRVARTPAGVWRGEFVYGRSYLERPDAVELDPVELTLGPSVRETVRLAGFFGAIRDAMPDAWGRRLVERRLGRSNLEEFDYLREGEDDRAGALGFGPEPVLAAPPPRAAGIPRLGDLAAAVAAVLRGDGHRHAEWTRDLVLPGTSLGGARPKTTVRDGRGLWLAKFRRPDDRWDEPRVEHAVLRLAARCGLSAAESRVQAVGDAAVLLVRRFDRDPVEEGFLRWRLVSGLTLLRAEDSVTGRDRWSYLLLADEMRRASVRPREDLRELFGRMCLNAAVGNGDDHPRNHALVAARGGWRLSPAYDLTPAPAVSREPPYLAMECGLEGRIASRENLLSGAGRFLLGRPDAEAILDTVFATVRAHWHDAMREAGVSVADRERIASAFVHSWWTGARPAAAAGSAAE
jgi:serine/threonine-protein kinase HipA